MSNPESTSFYLMLIFLLFLLMTLVFGKGDKKKNRTQSQYSISEKKEYGGTAKKRVALSARIENIKDKSSIEEAAELVNSHLDKSNVHSQIVRASYIKIFTDLCKEYEEEIKKCENEIKRTDKHYEKYLQDLNEEFIANDYGEEEERYQLKSWKDDYKEELNSENKILKWYEREIAKIRSDHSWLIKKYVAASNRESKEWGFFVSPDSLWQLDLPKEPPDSML